MIRKSFFIIFFYISAFSSISFWEYISLDETIEKIAQEKYIASTQDHILIEKVSKVVKHKECTELVELQNKRSSISNTIQQMYPWEWPIRAENLTTMYNINEPVYWWLSINFIENRYEYFSIKIDLEIENVMKSNVTHYFWEEISRYELSQMKDKDFWESLACAQKLGYRWLPTTDWGIMNVFR